MEWREVYTTFFKRIEGINLGEVHLRKVKVDIGVIDPKGFINGLLGLDLLIKIGAIIDLKRLTLRVEK